ncbi:DUF2127 domain-containing protein [Actinacidiphila sp. ITFR-21]|uniref:DUF2127 domain-containing protein n=1 Tax=Actinacidiphila sp. ITFR-21 TaxID=3075199 RepID=UPI002889AAB1|nr:DUF2127 domain-containing protein [Streptomyces sp. ITFR-21]WNI18163.1 DUF2127 domain-containing protein [Streptomyces sp. ITFR-21]
MSIDWDRRHCARKGHITYAPDEAALRGKLHAATAVGTVWRCLRCGDFVLGEPHGSGPADQAPLVPRGQALRDLLILRFLAVERVLRGLLIVLAAWAVWRFSNSQDAVHRLFEDDLTVFKPVADHFNYDLDHSPVVDSIQKVFDYKKSTLQLAAGGLLIYALVEIIEGFGLWWAKRWAEYLTVVATAAFLPIEVYELTEKISWFKIGTLALNVLAVLYILLGKRLFGLRGGHAAFEAQRRGASLLEVEVSAGQVPEAEAEQRAKEPLPVRRRSPADADTV